MSDAGEHTNATEALVPRWHESFYPVDLALLFTSPVFYGANVRRGNGSAVVLIPGFLHGDIYLILLYSWLSRIGYRPYFSGIGFNGDCPNLLTREFLDPVVSRARKETGSKVHLIGHSLGGIMARAVAMQRPNDVASVITLGSPFRKSVVHREVMQEAEIVRQYLLLSRGDKVRRECYTSSCGCPFMRCLRKGLPKRTPFTAIYTTNDGLLEWEYCRTGREGVDVGVKGTHAGLAFNPAVYEIIAERLASARPCGRGPRRAKASAA